MTQRKRSIAVLWHENQRKLGFNYMIMHYANVWIQDGYEVKFLFGPKDFQSADLVIVHVDLSVVPDPYLELAARYPIALNAKINDIRKSTLSPIRVTQADSWPGPVIVKSNLNFRGLPEKHLAGASAQGQPATSDATNDYRLFDSLAQVPSGIWADTDLIVERFVPEREGDLYVLRTMVVVGDMVTCMKNTGPDPILRFNNTAHREWAEPDPEIRELRLKLGVDIGKLDYVMYEGKPILLDVNKTMGGGGRDSNPARNLTRRKRAEGLYGYFDKLP